MLKYYQKKQGKAYSFAIRTLAKEAEKDITQLQNRLAKKDVEICKLNREVIKLKAL